MTDIERIEKIGDGRMKDNETNIILTHTDTIYLTSQALIADTSGVKT